MPFLGQATSGFLDPNFPNLDFQGLFDMVYKTLMGDMWDTPHIKARVDWVASSMSLTTQVVLRIRFLSHLRTLRDHKTPLVPGEGFDPNSVEDFTFQTVPHDKEWASSFDLDPVRTRDTQALSRDIVYWMEQTLREFAPKWYDYVPRIGFQGLTGRDLPLCPLFDPPATFSRNGDMYLVEGNPTAGITSMVPEQPECFFCGCPLPEKKDVIWAGASLQWVHTECWKECLS